MVRKQVVRTVWVLPEGPYVQNVVDEYAEKGMFLAQLTPVLDRDGDMCVWLVFKEQP